MLLMLQLTFNRKGNNLNQINFILQYIHKNKEQLKVKAMDVAQHALTIILKKK